MTTTVRVTYSAEGSPNTVMTFDLTGINIEAIKKELPLKKKELDTKFDVDPRKSSIKMDDISIRDPMIF
jgi:molybdopterin synthase catalytic subunit